MASEEDVDVLEARTGPGDRRRLILLSFLMLFLELALIRWTGSNILYLSYFSNFVLLGSFLGIGIGFLRARRTPNLFPWAPVALATLVAFVRLFPVEIDNRGTSLLFFGGSPTGLPRWLTLTTIFLAVAAVMAMVAEGVARTFTRFQALEAYRLDIIGSVAGIASFSLLSFLRAPPVVWGVIVAVLFASLALRRDTLGGVPSWGVVAQAVALVGLVAMLGHESVRATDSWSPYYKVRVEPRPEEDRIRIAVNGIAHQNISSVATQRSQASIYFLPYERLARDPGNVLIVGAGSGTDVAIALAEGARHVDAVEIDPRLYELGRDQHPDRPYQDPRVEVHIDDGRAFLERTTTRYDLILFALPDSLTLVSGQSSLRLESFLFTEEAIALARAHLAPGGVFSMYNFYRERWLVDRLAGTLAQEYGHAPCVDGLDYGRELAVMTVGLSAETVECPRPWMPQETVVEAAADDHPFVYLRSRTIPGFYLLTMGMILLASILLTRRVTESLRPMVRYLDLFFMGAAFLLLETKNVVQFALLFGTTWFVNALVFGGILLSVLAAVEVARTVRLPRPARVYAALLASLVVAWAIPQGELLEFPLLPRFVLAVAVAFTPIFLANLVFAQRFKDVGSSTTAFGANLLGAMVGGLLEYGALVVGYRSLLLAVAVLYGLAFLFGRSHLVEAAQA
jgi:SAM-dependent methyltransferase